MKVVKTKQNNQKRCLVIEDYSCMGRCSLTVALPILSACKIETIGIPTCVLSNHTAFESWTFADLSNYMRETANKWQNYNTHFDCIYTGYMNDDQIDAAIEIINKFKDENTIILVDPAFADNGKIYKGFDENKHINKLLDLIKYATYITPNLTEACFLSNTNTFDLDYLYSFFSKYNLKGMSITDYLVDKDKCGDYIIDFKENVKQSLITQRVDEKFHGAGDVYSSLFISCLLNGKSMIDSFAFSAKYVNKMMQQVKSNHLDGLHYGLPFEEFIPEITKELFKEN